MVKKNELLPVLFFSLIVLIFVFFFSTGFLSIAGNQDSDLLILSEAPSFITGENQPLGGNVVLASFIVGIGNDQAAIGSVDRETVKEEQINGIPSEYNVENADFIFTGKKVKMQTDVPFGSGQEIIRFPLLNDRVGLGSVVNVLIISELQKSQVEAAKNAYSSCSADSGYISFGWKADGYDAGGVLPGDEKGKITYVCVTTKSSFMVRSLVAPRKSFEMQFQITNASGAESSVLTLNEQETIGFLNAGGQKVAQVNVAGLVDSPGSPQLDLQGQYVSYQTGKAYSGARVENYLHELDTLFNAAPQGANWINYDNQNYSQVYALLESPGGGLGSFGTAYYDLINNARADISGFPFTANVNGIVVQSYYDQNPLIALTAKGDWLGIIRNVGELNIVCGEPVSGIQNQTVTESVAIENKSNFTQNYTVSFSCAGGSDSRTTTISANQSKQHDFSLSFAQPETGNCTFKLNWQGGNKSCNVQHTITGIPESCGDGIGQGTEQCDGMDLRGQSCFSLGYSGGGNLACTPSCTYNVALCEGEPVEPELVPAEVCGLFGVQGLLYHEVVRIVSSPNCLVNLPFGICLFQNGVHAVSTTTCELDLIQAIIGLLLIAIIFIAIPLAGKRRKR